MVFAPTHVDGDDKWISFVYAYTIIIELQIKKGSNIHTGICIHLPTHVNHVVVVVDVVFVAVAILITSLPVIHVTLEERIAPEADNASVRLHGFFVFWRPCTGIPPTGTR